MKKTWIVSLLIGMILLTSCGSPGTGTTSSEVSSLVLESSSKPLSSVEFVSSDIMSSDIPESLRFSEMLGLPARDYFNSYGNSLDIEPSFPGIDGKLYRFYIEDFSMKYASFDLTSFEENLGVLYNFQMPISHYTFMDDTLLVFTKKAIYSFDKELELQKTVVYPTIFVNEWTEGSSIDNLVVDKDLTSLAYATKEGLYYSSLSLDSIPVLIEKTAISESMTDSAYPFPIRFLESGNILIAHSLWEAIGNFAILDKNGSILEEFPYSTSGMHSGGNCTVTDNGFLLSPMEDEASPFYYDFATGKKTEIYLEEENAHITSIVFDSNHPEILYIGISASEYENSQRVQEVNSFYKITLSTGKMESMCAPITISSEASWHYALLFAAHNDKILLVYEENSESKIELLDIF